MITSERVIEKIQGDKVLIIQILNDFDNLKNIAVNLNERLLNDDKSL